MCKYIDALKEAKDAAKNATRQLNEIMVMKTSLQNERDSLAMQVYKEHHC